MSKFKTLYLISGIVLIIVSFLSFGFTEQLDTKSSLFFGASYYLGGLIIANWIIIKIKGFSLISRIIHNKRVFFNFFIICSIGGVIFSLVVSALGGFWYFPFWTTQNYFIFGYVLGGWTFYFLFIVVSYEAGKIFFDYLSKGKKVVTRYYKYENHLYHLLFVIGVCLLLYVTTVAIINTNFFRDFQYNITTIKTPYLEWQYWLVSFVGLLFVCEFVEFKRKRTSLFKDTLHGYYSPILSIIFVSTILAITNEVQNLGVYLWRYTNYPLQDINILNIPIFVILTWPLHILAILEFWRAFGDKSSELVFHGDDIE